MKSTFLLILALYSGLWLGGQPLSGVYTIGGSNPDYATISSAASALNTLGVSGPVIFNIASGIYSENVQVGPVQGASAVNHIVFQSVALDSTAVVITFPASTTTISNYVLRLNGASHTTFKYLTFERTGTSDYSQVIDIINGSQFIHFYHNRIIGTTATTPASYKSLVHGPNASSQSNIVFDGNRMENGSYGIWLLGISQLICCIDVGNVIKNNHLINQYQCGIMLSYNSGPQIINNTIEGVSAASGFGIYTFFSDNNIRILKNKISVVNGKGIYVHNASIAGIPENLIANNFVTVGGAGAADGISLDNSRSCHVYHNSVHIVNTATSSAAFRVNGISSSFNELKNNNLVNSGGGYALVVTASTNQPFNVSNYNNLYVADTLLGFWQAAGSQSTLAAYRTASQQEQQSVSLDPGYLSPTDLHCTSMLFDNQGTPFLSSATPVAEDIDGESRSMITPDIGADEFGVADLALVYVDTIFSFCAAQPGVLQVKVHNSLPIQFHDSVRFHVMLSGQVHSVQQVLLVIPASDTLAITLSGLPGWPATGGYQLKLYITTPWDLNENNDTLTATVFIAPEPIADLGSDTVLCANQQIILSPGSFQQYLWHDSTTTPVWLADGASMTPGVNQVVVSVVDIRGCVAADSLTIDVLPVPLPKISADPSFSGTIAGIPYTIVCQKFTTTFNASGSFNSYHWQNGSNDSILQLLPFQTNMGPLSVTVMVSNAEGCFNSDTLAVYVDNCEGIDEHPAPLALRVAPNPSNDGRFKLQVENGVGQMQLRIFNIHGEVIVNQHYIGDFSDSYELDLSAMPKGVYLLQCNAGKELCTIRMLII
jgi:parallel beta-helix repeat protein